MDVMSKIQSIDQPRKNYTGPKSKCKQCNDSNPCINLLDLMYILLRKFKKLLTVEIWDYVSTLFPYYEELWDPIQGNTEIHKILEQNKKIFIISHHIPACPGVYMVTLVAPCNSSSDIQGAYGNPLEKFMSSHKEDLVLWLKDVGMLPPAYRKHPRPVLSSYTSGFSPQRSPENDRRISDIESEDTPVVKRCCNEGDRKMSTSDEQDVSSDIEIIVDKCNVEKPISLLCAKDTPVVKRYCSEDDRKMSTSDEQDISSDIEIIVDKCNIRKPISILCNENLVKSPIQTSPKKSSHFKVSSEPANLNLIDKVQFSYIDLGTCMVSSLPINIALPPEETMWKEDSAETLKVEQTFNCLRSTFLEYSQRHKWLKLSDLSNLIVCSSCKYIEKKYGVAGLSLQIPLNEFNPSNFAKFVHRHDEQKTHKAAHLIARKQLSTVLRFVLLNHFNDFNDFSDMIETLQRLLPDERITLDDLEKYITLLGEYLDFEILESAKRAQCASIIADPCRGYLILRFIKNAVPVEHLLTSYMTCTDKSPLEYLSKLLPDTRIPFYMCNDVCNSCRRCKATKTEKIPAIPLALPQIRLFQKFLWRTKLLSGYFVFASTVLELCQVLKNHELEEQIDLKRLSQFPIVPSELVRLCSHEQVVKSYVNAVKSSDVEQDVELIMTFDWSRLKDFRQVFLLLEDLNMCLLRLKQDISAFDELYVHMERFQALANTKMKDAVDIKKWEEVSSLITLTVKELQYTVYHKCRYLLSSFKTATSLQNLSDSSSSKSFDKLYRIVKMNGACDDSKLFRCCLKKFLKSHPHLEGRTSCEVLLFFKENAHEKQKYPHSFQFYATLSLIGLHKSYSSRSLYEMQIFEHQFHRSAWSSLGANAKSHLLTVVSELAAGTQVREQRMTEFFFAVI